MGIEVVYGQIWLHCVCGILVAPILYPVCCVTDVILHVFKYLIVKDMLFGDNAGQFESKQECVVCPYHLSVLAVLHGLDENGVAINFHHNYDVLVASKRLDGELPGLVNEHGFAYHVHLGV